MVEPKHVPRQHPHPPTDHPLATLATALQPYGVRYRYVEDEGRAPSLRVGNPESRFAVEDIHYAPRRAGGHSFLSSYGVRMGTSDDISDAAERVAWLVGATAF